jgi:hypothetical protein
MSDDSGDGDRVAGAAVDLGELVFGTGEADFEALDFAEPAFVFGFGDAGEEVVADLGDAWPLGGSGQCIEHRRRAWGFVIVRIGVNLRSGRPRVRL